MSRAELILNSKASREKASSWAWRLPPGTRVEFKAPKRTLPQNDRLWAMLTDIASQARYHGLKLTTNDWKLIFLDGLRKENRMVPNLLGDGFLNLGRSSSDLSKAEMTDLIELMLAWGARNDIVFHDAESEAA